MRLRFLQIIFLGWHWWYSGELSCLPDFFPVCCLSLSFWVRGSSQRTIDPWLTTHSSTGSTKAGWELHGLGWAMATLDSLELERAELFTWRNTTVSVLGLSFADGQKNLPNLSPECISLASTILQTNYRRGLKGLSIQIVNFLLLLIFSGRYNALLCLVTRPLCLTINRE